MVGFEIECPYCFGEKFKDDEVEFRSRTYFKGNMSELILEITNGAYRDEEDLEFITDKKLKEEYKAKIAQKKSLGEKGKSEKFKNFWKKYGNEDNAIENPSRDPDIDYDYNRPVFALNSSAFTKVDKDEAGFVKYVTDAAGFESNMRVCPHCNNPLPAEYGKYPVCHISVIGAKGSGKTVFLSQFLKTLQEECSKIGIQSGTPDSTITSYINTNRVAVGENLPSPTEWNFLVPPLSINLAIKEKKTTFVFHDIAGESCLENADGATTFAQFIKHSNAMILIIDPKQIETFGIELKDGEQPVNIAAVATKIAEVYGENLIKNLPVAVVISQTDRDECKKVLKDDCPKLYQPKLEPCHTNPLSAKSNPMFNGTEYNEIFRKLDQIFLTENAIVNLKGALGNMNYFGISAIGGEVNNNKPVDTPVPYRVAEPFFWILYKLGYIKSNVPVCERVEFDEFKEKVIKAAESADIGLNETVPKLFRKNSVKSSIYGTYKTKNETNLNNIIECLRQYYICEEPMEGAE